MTRFASLLLAVGGLAASSTGAGCADEPVAYSETVSLKLSGMKDGDIRNNELNEEKNVNSESGNPYAVFVKNAEAQLGGAAPARIAPLSAFIRIHADSTGIASFQQVFTDLELFFSNSATTIPVGSVAGPTGSSVEVALNEVSLEPLHDAMLAGDFKVGVRGVVVDPPPADKFDLRLTIDIRFEAYAP